MSLIPVNYKKNILDISFIYKLGEIFFKENFNYRQVQHALLLVILFNVCIRYIVTSVSL